MSPADNAQSQFVTECPNHLWVADFSVVLTGTQVAFVTDTFSHKIIGWSVS